MMENQAKEIKIQVGNELKTFTGYLLESVDGTPRLGFDNYVNYSVYKREADNYFVCHDEQEERFKIVESEKQVVDFFGWNLVAKNLYERLGIATTQLISKNAHGLCIELVVENDYNIAFYGKRIMRSFAGDSDLLYELYITSDGQYVFCTKDSGSYCDVKVLEKA